MAKLIRAVSLSMLLVVALALGLLASNLYTFNRLTDEAPIAKLRFVKIKPQQYQLELRSGDFCTKRTYQVFGDEWRIDARFLKWKPWANLVGMDSLYRLERVSGRYQNIDDANSEIHVAHDVGEKPEIDLFDHVKKEWMRWSPVDTRFGSSVYEAMDPDYEYTVYRTQSGLVVRKQSALPAHYEGGDLVIHIEKDCIGDP